MIDYLKLRSNINIQESMINKDLFKKEIYKVERHQEFGEEEKECFIYRKNNFAIRYYPNSETLYIEGKIINYSILKNTFYVADDLYVGIFNEDGIHKQDQENTFTDINTIFDSINDILFKLTKTKLDIRTFQVTRIDPCFNLYTFFKIQYTNGVLGFIDVPCEDKYILLFNEIFKSKKNASYINHCINMNYPLHGSLYLRTKTAYEKTNSKGKQVGSNEYRTTNFYNKAYQLQDLKDKADKKEYTTNITSEDIEKAKCILRLEVQIGNKELYKLKGSHRPLKDFINIDWCRDEVVKDYKKFISKNEYLDFYSYTEAKDIISNTNTISKADKDKVIKHLGKLARGNKPQDKQIKATLEHLGIHPYIIPKSWNIPYLPSPIRLLDDHIQRMKEGYKKQRELLGDRVDDVVDDIDVVEVEDLSWLYE